MSQSGTAIDKTEDQGATRRLKALVVDDNAASAKTIGWMLEAMGHDPHLVFEVKDVVAIATDLKPDVILLDIGMPGKSGYDLCRELKVIPQLSGVLFIAQTGWGAEKDRAMAKDAGFDFHLVKPFRLSVLEDLLSNHFAEKL